MLADARRGLTRRRFLQGLSTATAAWPMVTTLWRDGQAATASFGEGQAIRPVTLKVNGAVYRLELEARRTLADVIRKELGLTGTKVVCDHASCGACTVLLEGRTVFSCHLLAVQADSQAIETIEGLADGEKLHPIQEAFIEYDAYQCGFCTPGMIMAIKGALARHPRATREQIQQAIAGNLCRCAAYNHILDAALAAAPQMGGQHS
jgi:aerobic-type carbon monoxide dehydrogenase small subunit (CoxS/CutS family)